MTEKGFETDAVGLYLEDIGRYKLLTREDEQRLGSQKLAGECAQAELSIFDDDRAVYTESVTVEPAALYLSGLNRSVRQAERAREQMINANLRLVVNIAKKNRQPGVEIEDKIQTGNIGLMRAVEKFDHRKGFKFSTYATYWIKQSIARRQFNDELIKRTASLREEIRSYGAFKALREEQGEKVSIELLARDMRKKPNALLRIVEEVERGNTVYLDAELSETNSMSLGDTVAAVDDVESEVLEADYADFLLEAITDSTYLTEQEKFVLVARFYEEQTFDAIGTEVGLTRERIRQIQTKGLNKLRNALGKNSEGASGASGQQCILVTDDRG